MKTTIELPDDLLNEAKKKAVDDRTTLRALVEQGLQIVVRGGAQPSPKRSRIKWVVVDSGLPKGLDVSDRRKMMEYLLRDRLRY